jgi:hypothetical protein
MLLVSVCMSEQMEPDFDSPPNDNKEMMMTTIKKTLLISLSLLALQGIATAAIANSQESLMATLDKDLDGLISLKEAAGHAKLLEKFNQVDLNEDGYISIDELFASDIGND